MKARWEWLPLRMPNPLNPEQVFQSIAIGNLLDLLVLDTRTRRDPPHDGLPINDAARTALGLPQRDWLLRELDSSQARWQLIASLTLMAEVWNSSLPPSCMHALRTLKLIGLQYDDPDADPWAGYPHERDLILRHIQGAKRFNVVVLSGDVHVSLAAELSGLGRGSTDDPVAVEFVTPSITSHNLDDKMGWAPRTKSLPIEQALSDSAARFKWCELDSHGYVIVDVNCERVQGEWWFVDAIQACYGEKCGAVWKVERGQPRLIAISPSST